MLESSREMTLEVESSRHIHPSSKDLLNTFDVSGTVLVGEFCTVQFKGVRPMLLWKVWVKAQSSSYTARHGIWRL